MGMRELEAAILEELRVVANNPKIKKADIMEWSSGEVEKNDGEQIYHLPKLGINVAVAIPAPKGTK